jgi:hypothetical protein
MDLAWSQLDNRLQDSGARLVATDLQTADAIASNNACRSFDQRLWRRAKLNAVSAYTSILLNSAVAHQRKSRVGTLRAEAVWCSGT